MTEITKMRTIFLVLKHPKNMHIKFLSISEVPAGKRHDFNSNRDKPFAHWSGMTVSTRDRLHNSPFFSNQHTHYHIDFALLSTMVGGHEKQIDSNTIHLHQHQHQQCLQIGTLHYLCEMSGLIHNMLG